MARRRERTSKAARQAAVGFLMTEEALRDADGRATDEQQVEPAPARRSDGRLRFPQISLALSAFIMSLVVTLIGAYYALQGPEIVVRPPEQVVLYRDGDKDAAILGIALRLDMINGASDYGDVMLDGELTPGAGQAVFAFQSVLKPIFTASAPEAARSCDLGSRCIGHPGLLLIEQPDALVDVPGGAAKAMHLSFPMAEWNCTGQRCRAFGTFDQAVAALAGQPLRLKLNLKFNSDGERTIICGGSAIDANYLKQVGWVSIACKDSSVSGEPFL